MVKIIDPPDWKEIFLGETVTLQCEIPRGEGRMWTYSWYKNGQEVHRYEEQREYRFTTTANDNAEFTCKGTTRSSYPIKLSLSDLPRATLTVEPERPVFTGESVTLKCEIHTHDGWTYQWYKQDPWLRWTAVSQSVYYTVNRDSLTIRGDAVINGDHYLCSGQRRYRPTSSQYSNSVTLIVYVFKFFNLKLGTFKKRPKAVVSIQPGDQVFIGETVTLRCDIQGGGVSDWQFSWFKDDPYRPVSNEQQYSISSVTESHRGKYTCSGTERGTSRSSHTSDAVTLTVSDPPRATLTVEPRWSPVFTGESVTLKCEIQSYSYWRYQWYKGSSRTAVSHSQTNTFTIRSAADQDQYWCRGERDYRPTSSQNSNPVTLTVKTEKPKPELTSSHKGAALIGNPVVLYCRLDQSAGWKFYWSKHTQSPENETKTETHSYTISSVSVSDGGQYWCRAGRGDPVYYTHYSDALWISVTGVFRPVSLMVSPSRAQHFITDSLSLSCEGQSDSTGWRVRRYTHSEKVSDCSSGWGSVTGSTCNISSLSTSHTGVYWCESGSGESSNPVNITVTNGAVILDSPVHPVTEGDPLTLRCLYRDPKPSNLTAEFYKNGSLLQTQTTGEMTFRTVSKSDEGLYHCKHPEKGESPQSWISVKGASNSGTLFSVFNLLSSLMAVSPYLLVTIVLVKYYRAQAKPDEESRT
ncbi:hypothetical protein MHYP_G00013430 [Metynnis hypsauchen]